jgi:porin
MIDGGNAMVKRSDRCRSHRAAVIAVATVAGLLTLPPGVAAQDSEAMPEPEIQRTTPATETERESEAGESHKGGLWERDVLTGDWNGLRSSLEKKGLKLGLNYIGEVLGNPVGGVKHGTIYEGRLEAVLELDLERAVGWTGGTFHVNAYQLHGRGLSANYLGNNQLTASSIEASRSTRLFDLWLQQTLFDDRLSVRIGQIAADDEFIISQYAANFINGTFGWPGILAVNAVSGGPADPLATPGVRIALAASKQLLFSAAVFNGDPAGPGPGNPQERDASGTSFRIGDGAFSIAEAAYAINQEKDAAGLPGTYKLGGYYHTGRFDDPREDDTGRSLADPASSGRPAIRHTHYGFYLVADQMVWRKAETTDQGLALFARVAGDPSPGDQVKFYADGGINYKGLLPNRDDDVFGIAVAYANGSNEVRGMDGDTNRFAGSNRPIRDFEAMLELTYRAQLAPWWSVQPDLQFIFHPGGNIARPNDPSGTQAIPNAVVLGLRSAVAF